MPIEVWKTQEDLHTGYFGSNRDQMHRQFDTYFGAGRWRVAWRLANGEVQDYPNQFYQNFVGGYAAHFLKYPDEARQLTDGYSYTFDETSISKEEAFDPYAYYNRPVFQTRFIMRV